MLLNKYYVPKQLCKIFENFLRNRTVLLENEMEPWKHDVGVPQGSCARPIPWFLIENEALNKFGVDTEVKVQAFADDRLHCIVSFFSNWNFSFGYARKEG
ncbi:hypothetical protein AVEN_84745-1 [Araneus ventricosus]|uniref:Reverse transcriptase domain-containing protein n=1 Tax=Araneus ventricosus TaxID=182803 RepID=A0A4Y2UD61_ARAVE|nr:hypothetical protein AVEN_84745-1 [Araneus ventricosus]